MKLTQLWLPLLVALGLCNGVACAPPRSSRITIGAKNFTEQTVVGELLAQEIEALGGGRVERRFYLAGSYICQQALVGGRIDAYVEYTGTALTAILKQPVDRDPERVMTTITRLYRERYDVGVGRSLGFEDTFAMVVRGPEAKRLNLTTLSSLVAHAPSMHLAVGYEFEERPDGLRGLQQAYGLSFAGAPRVMDLGLLYRALAANQVDIVAGNSTDGPIQAFGFFALQDDRHYFPPYQAVPLVRLESLRAHPVLGRAVDRLAGQVAESDIRAMNDAVDREHKDVGEAVRAFREKKGL